MVYTDTDPHGPERKIATDLLSHCLHIFIASGKGRPAYQRLIKLQQRVNCKDGVLKHPFRHRDRSSNRVGPHRAVWAVCNAECVATSMYVQVCGTWLWLRNQASVTSTRLKPAHSTVWQSVLQSPQGCLGLTHWTDGQGVERLAREERRLAGDVPRKWGGRMGCWLQPCPWGSHCPLALHSWVS
jgi:hypothetical protein